MKQREQQHQQEEDTLNQTGHGVEEKAKDASPQQQPPLGKEDEVEEEEDCRKPFLQLFILITCLGSVVLGLAQAWVDHCFSFSTAGCIICALSTAVLLFISMRHNQCSVWQVAHILRSRAPPSPEEVRRARVELMVGLYAYSGFLNFVLSMCVLTDVEARDLYAWFMCIPLLFLYARGVRACVVTLVLVSLQTTALRLIRRSWDLTTILPPTTIRHTFVGETYCDCWLLLLVTTLSACHHHAHTRALARLKAALREKDAANVELQHATQAKSEFLANMSHELRTPMHGIIAMSRELQDLLMPSSKAVHAVSIISDCAEHMLSLVSDILDFERIESNQLQLEAIPFSIAEEAQKAVHLLQITADKKKLALSLRTAVAHPLHVGDPLRFRQVLFNLLSNAIKFTPDHGSVSVTVRNDDQDDPDQVIVAVQDTGIGISAENRKLLFSPFSQLDTSICRKFGGSGLGLAISQRLCRAMGGGIDCESHPGRGSTFTCRFRLPAVDRGAQPNGLDRDTTTSASVLALSGQVAQEAEREEVTPEVDGLRVLLVEDNMINQKVGKRMLSSLHCNVAVADNGEECLKALAESKEGFDVVLMDCQMPVMDGFQATKHIRRMEAERPQSGTPADAKPPLPVIALTASATKEYADRCLEVGMSDVLFKPLRRETLAAALAKWKPSSVAAAGSSASKHIAATPSISCQRRSNAAPVPPDPVARLGKQRE